MTHESSPWWHPGLHADRRPLLLTRNRILAGIRAWFAARDFVEVEAAALQVSPGNEAHLSAFATEAILPDGGREPLYLHTSPRGGGSRACSASPTSSAIASAARCTIPNLRCSNGTGRARPTRR